MDSYARAPLHVKCLDPGDRLIWNGGIPYEMINEMGAHSICMERRHCSSYALPAYDSTHVRLFLSSRAHAFATHTTRSFFPGPRVRNAHDTARRSTMVEVSRGGGGGGGGGLRGRGGGLGGTGLEGGMGWGSGGRGKVRRAGEFGKRRRGEKGVAREGTVHGVGGWWV